MKIACLPNGPYYLLDEGPPAPIESLCRQDGSPCKTVRGVALCRCGGSANKPFCDGTHGRAGFQSECKASKLPPPGAEGPVAFDTLIRQAASAYDVEYALVKAIIKAESGFKMGINYGWNKVRYTAPVPAGARIRASLETLSVDDKGDGWYQLVQKWTVEIEGQEKPALFAESVVRLLA